MVILQGLIHNLKSYNYILNSYHHVKVLCEHHSIGSNVGSLEDKILDPINNPPLLIDMRPLRTETERALMLS